MALNSLCPPAVFQDINSSGRNPQAYINSVLMQGGPLGPTGGPLMPPMMGQPGGAGPMGQAPPPMMMPPDRFFHPGGHEEASFWQTSPVVRWIIYALAIVGIWKLGVNSLVKDLSISFHNRKSRSSEE